MLKPAVIKVVVLIKWRLLEFLVMFLIFDLVAGLFSSLSV
jgi:hypothetical protein